MTQTTAVNPLQKYFRQPKVYLTLPSKGKYYPEGSIEKVDNNEYPVFAMTARDEMIIKTPDALLNGQATVDIIQSCVPNIKDAWQMPSLDIDACLIAIRIATYGENMDISVKVPITGEEKDFELDLRPILEQLIHAEYTDVLHFQDMIFNLKPLKYKEYTQINLKTFEEQRIFNVINDESIPDDQKLSEFGKSFKKLTDITVGTIKDSIRSVVVGEQEVTEREFINEFIDNADKQTFEAIKSHLEKQRENFEIKPFVVDATPEEIEQGVPNTYEIPITFDNSNFFALGS